MPVELMLACKIASLCNSSNHKLMRMEKETLQETEEGASVLQEFCAGALTEDAYWNIYRRYNMTRLLIYANLKQWFLDEQGLVFDNGQYEAEVDRWVKAAKIVYRKKFPGRCFKARRCWWEERSCFWRGICRTNFLVKEKEILYTRNRISFHAQPYA